MSTSADVIAAVDVRLDSIEDVRIATKADYWDEERRERIAGRDVSISAALPGSLRVTLSSFDKALASLASDGVDFAMLDLQNNIYYYGPATAQNISKLIPIYLSGEDFVRVLCGGFPTDTLVVGWRESTTLSWNDHSGRYRLDMPTVDGTQQVELTHPDLAVAEIRIRRDDEDVYIYRAKNFTAIDGIPTAKKSRFELVEREIDVTLRIERWDYNVEPPETLYRIAPPAGSELVPLGP